MKKKLKVVAAALLASALPLSGCTVLGFEIPGTESIPNVKIPGADLVKDLLNKVDIFDIIPDGDDDGDDNQGYDNDGDNTTTKTVTNVTVTGGKNLIAGQTVTLTAKVSGDNLSESDKTVSWSSSSTTVAEVSSSGIVTAKSAGTVVITATSTLDSTKKGTATIVVSPAAWSDADKAMFTTSFGEAIPFVILPSGGSWTDEYFVDYECLSFEVAGDKADEIIAEIDKNSAYVELQDGIYSVAMTKTANAVFYIDVYYYEKGDLTSIDVYKAFTKWPTQEIASRLTEIGVTLGSGYSLPALPDESGMLIQVMNSALQGEDEYTPGDPVVVVSVSCADNSQTLAKTYYDLLGDVESKYVVLGEEGNYQLQAKDQSHTILLYDSYDDDMYMYYMVYSMYGMLDELLADLGMTEDELIEYIETPFPGFTLVVAPYQYDYSIYPTGSNELLAVGDTFQIETQLGSDVPQDAVLTYTSGTPTVATVSETGLITAVANGIANITVAYEDKASVTFIINVVETLPTAWTEEQIGEIQKLYPVVEIPFIKYFDNVQFNTAGEYVEFTSSLAYAYDQIDAIGEILEAAGWELQSEYEETCASDEVYYEGAAYFEKVYQIEGVDHYVSIALGFDSSGSDEEEAEALPIIMEVSDPYLYSFAEAAQEIVGGLGQLDIETTATVPEFSATRYSVVVDDYYGSVNVVAYNEGKTLDQVKALLEALGYEVQQLAQGEIAYLDALSEDLAIEIVTYVDGTDLIFQIYGTEGGGEEESGGATFDFSEFTETSGEMNGISFTTAKAGGQTAPAYNANYQQLRLYAKNTMVVASTGDPVTSIDIECTFDNNGTLTASTGTLTSVAGGYHWEGSASEVTFTVSDKGQVRITSMTINGGGEGGGGESAGFEALMAKVETAYGIELEYDDEEDVYFSEEVAASSTSKTMMQVINEAVVKKPAEFSIEYEAPYEDTWSDGEAGAFACYLTADQSAVLQLGTWVENGQIYLQVVIYEI